jgi:hypothetical protein
LCSGRPEGQEHANTGCYLEVVPNRKLVWTGAVSDTVGGEVLEMSADNFRQCLARARRDLYQFMHDRCGLVNADNPCRCPKKTRGFIAAGHVDPDRLLFASRHALQVRTAAGDAVREIENTLDRQYADVFRGHPFHQPPDQVAWLRRLFDQPAVRTALRLT